MDEEGNLDKETNEANETRRAPPDGGWGWVIVFAVFIGNCLMDGCIGSYGIFYPELLRAFNAGPVVTSMAGSLLPAVYMISSPVVGSLNLRFGSRPVCFVGGCIGAIGLVLASISSNIVVFMVTFGVIVGIGIGMNYLPGHVITNNYFEKKRGIAGGIVCAGAGFGVFILAPIFQLLLTGYGWRGAMLITSGIFMQLCVCSMLMRPLRRQMKKEDGHCKHKDVSDINERDPMLETEIQNDTHTVNDVRTETDGNDKDTYRATESVYKGSDQEIFRLCKERKKDPLTRLKLTDRSSSDDTLSGHHKRVNNCIGVNIVAKSLQYIPKDPTSSMQTDLTKSQFLEPVALLGQSQQIARENQLNTQGHTNVKDNLRVWKIVSCDTSIFRNKNYIPLLLGGIFIQMGQFIPNTFLPDYCQTIGLDGKQISIIMAIYGAVNIFGRLSAGCLANMKRFDALWLCNVGMLMCGIGCALFSFCTTFASVCMYAIGVGYFIGYFPPLQILIMVEHLGIDKLPSSLGFLQMAKGPAALFGPPLAGLVYQYSKNYALSLGFAAILFFLAAGIQSLVPISNMCSQTANDTKMNTETEIIVN